MHVEMANNSNRKLAIQLYAFKDKKLSSWFCVHILHSSVL